MKKIFLLTCTMLLTVLTFAQDVKKVAILEVVDREGKLSYSQKLMLRSNLSRAVTNTEGFEAFDRTDVDQIMEEQNFQRTGMVSNDQIKRLGEMTGAAYILVAEGTLTEDNKIFVMAKILNVESTKLMVTDNYLMGTSSSEMQRGCRALASKMFGTMAGASTSTNKFMDLFKKKQQSSTKQAEDSIAAARKAEEAAAVAAALELQRLEEQRIRQEQADAEAKARQERAAAEEKARQERAAAELAAKEQKRLDAERKKAEEEERAKYYITKLNAKEYLYLGNTMSKKDYENFLKNNCPEAFSQYHNGKKLIGAGWGLFGAGLVVTAGGGALFALYAIAEGDKSFPNLSVFEIIGPVVMGVGGAMTLASIPVLGVGYNKQKKSVKTYNNKCASSDIQPLALNLTAGQNGLGLALQF